MEKEMNCTYKYKTPILYYEPLKKKIESVIRKLNKYGLKYIFEEGPTSIEYVDVYEADHVNHCWVKTRTYATDVISYNFEMELIKLGKWKLVASIEHNVGTEDGKMYNDVKMMDLNYSYNPEWQFIEPKCEHCNSNRRRNKTVILANDEGEFKQVGTSCLKEFTGIDAEKIISIYGQVHDKYIDEFDTEPKLYSDDLAGLKYYVPTIEYLARCIYLINKFGYVSDYYDSHCTKTYAMYNYDDINISQSDLDKASEIIEFFKTQCNESYTDEFLLNIANALKNKFTRVNGFIAYAPIAYRKANAVNNAVNKAVNKSEWQGNVGDKVELKLIRTNSIFYDTQYGTMHIEVFEDESGNVYKWFTSAYFEANNDESYIVKGTIKAHDEYNGQKETILTRCKVKACPSIKSSDNKHEPETFDIDEIFNVLETC